MPFVDEVGALAVPPTAAEPAPREEWGGRIELDDGYGLLHDVHIEGAVPLDGCSELEIVKCVLSGVSFDASPAVRLDIRQSSFEACDLSGAVISSLTASTLADCKLIGTDLSQADIRNVIVRDGLLRYRSVKVSSQAIFIIL